MLGISSGFFTYIRGVQSGMEGESPLVLQCGACFTMWLNAAVVAMQLQSFRTSGALYCLCASPSADVCRH